MSERESEGPIETAKRLQARHLAIAAVAIVLVGALTIALAEISRFGGRSPLPAESGAVATAGARATPTAQAITGSAFDLPVIQVTDAIAVRDAGMDDRELAVQGWFANGGIPACPAPLVSPVNPLQTGCPDGFVWLMEQAELLIHRSGNQTTGGRPSGPAVNPDLDGIDGVWQPADQGLDANGDSTPIDVVLVGHFDDRRAALCPEAEVDACRDRFVVDAVASVHGVAQPLSVMRYASPTSPMAEVEAIVANEAPRSPILSMVITDGAEGLPAIEPSLADGQQGLTARPVVWIVRVLESERVGTYVVVDGTDAIYEMTQEGEAVKVGGTIVEPTTATPSDGPLAYDLDCGPLGLDTCRDKAAGVIAANETGSPTNRIVSIAFFDECGSYTVLFDDGSGTTASVDCVVP